MEKNAKREIPKCMGTHHPDNVKRPFFAKTPLISGETELKEAIVGFKELGIKEQMWDFEGKEADAYVIKKLLMADPDFFRSCVIGKDCFITLRIPNPTVEKAEGKSIFETLGCIPRSYDISKEFYQNGNVPIFEVILPMTTSWKEPATVKEYYEKFIVGKADVEIVGKKVSDWVGKFNPQTISVIPLIERVPEMIALEKIVLPYIEHTKPDYMRVFLARSDPALNYGYVSAFLAAEIALLTLHDISQKTGIAIYPIFGMGSPPFRGHLTPGNVERCLKSYPSVQTFTLQSAFRYDHDKEKVKEAVEKINAHTQAAPREIDATRSEEIISRFISTYQHTVEAIAPLVNSVAAFMPKRRLRVSHTGLFGYARGEGKVKLPRAIGFCGSLYSVGIPPEILGMDALTREDLDYLKKDESFASDMHFAARFANPEIIRKELSSVHSKIISEFGEPDKMYIKLSKAIYHAIKFDTSDMDSLMLEAAEHRNFLG